ncbi:MAG: ATP-binding cassette domain-containing protein, partial [Nanoarchaeota archaeon]|nr:ATP-binding cassette domain-containing protein [Nanoarchaeota archaeon]
TLINLILRLYDIQKGAILINNENIEEVTLSSLRNNISLVSQESCLFNRTIFENIHF